jgi:glycerol-3-phosphate dehydrogenase (NAD(P)+)
METARQACRLFECGYIRAYASTDVIGVEVGGALKNIFAIAAGAFEGMGFGMNGAAMLVTRGCKEMNRLAIAMGANPHTLTCVLSFFPTILHTVLEASRALVTSCLRASVRRLEIGQLEPGWVAERQSKRC